MWKGAIEVQVEQEHVHARFAQKAEIAALSVGGNECSDLTDGCCTGFRDAVDLCLG